MLEAGLGVKQSFNTDVDGSFIITAEGTSPDRASFVEAIKSEPTLILNIKPEELKGDVLRIVSEAIQDSTALRKLSTKVNTKDADQRETFDLLLRDVYKDVSARTDAKAKELKKYLEESSIFQKRIASFKKPPKKEPGGGEGGGVPPWGTLA